VACLVRVNMPPRAPRPPRGPREHFFRVRKKICKFVLCVCLCVDRGRNKYQ